MKLDGETVLSRKSVDSKSDQKLVEDNNGAIEDQLQYAASDSTSDDEEKLRDFVSPTRFNCSSLKSESLEKDSVFYVDKSVMEPELPELVVCYKENTYQVVKDICIDEGIPSKGKFLFDTDVDEEQLCTLLKSEDKNSEIELHNSLKSSTEKENLAIGDPVTDGLLSSKEMRLGNEISLEHDMNKSMSIEKTGNGASREIFSLGELLSMAAKSKSSNKSIDKTEQLSQRPLETTILTKSRDPEESENVNEPSSSSLASPTTDYISEKPDFDEASNSIQIPDSETAAEKSQNDSKEEAPESHKSDATSETNRTNDDKSNNCQSEETRNPDSSTRGEESSPFSSQLQYGQGESSFSAAAGPVSGLITYSGPIAHSGSLSLRSDSSTTSTRSFAFPILQSEWNSSPVRMAKAERRRSHGSWRQAILCCRF